MGHVTEKVLKALKKEKWTEQRKLSKRLKITEYSVCAGLQRLENFGIIEYKYEGTTKLWRRV